MPKIALFSWLGHPARMSDNRMPKIALFSWLTTPRPCWGPKRRWRDVIKKDLVALKIPLDTWYDQTQNRKSWCEFCGEGTLAYQLYLQQLRQQRSSRTIECNICGRFFHREVDKARHKCLNERQKPVCQQQGSVQCGSCGRWFRSRGGLTVHRCQ